MKIDPTARTADERFPQFHFDSITFGKFPFVLYRAIPIGNATGHRTDSFSYCFT
jgi:hypothetical protein